LILSAPSTIAVKSWEDMRTGELWQAIRLSFLEFAAAFLIALVIGMTLGLIFYRFRSIGSAVEPLLLAFYAAPTILLYPVFLALFGLESGAVVSIAVILGTIPIMVNVRAGLVGVERIFLKLGRSLRATRWQMFWKVLLPAATPTIFSGVRLGFTYCLVGVIAVEFLLFSGGLGRMVSWRYFIFDSEGMYAGIAFVIAIAALVNGVVRRIEDRIRTRWV
jgi:NitT/TauT family transport system permease protein